MQQLLYIAASKLDTKQTGQHAPTTPTTRNSGRSASGSGRSATRRGGSLMWTAEGDGVELEGRGEVVQA